MRRDEGHVDKGTGGRLGVCVGDGGGGRGSVGGQRWCQVGATSGRCEG